MEPTATDPNLQDQREKLIKKQAAHMRSKSTEFDMIDNDTFVFHDRITLFTSDKHKNETPNFKDGSLTQRESFQMQKP